MEDVFFKYGVVIVGVVIITLLMSFAFNSLNKTLVIADEKEQEYSGTSDDIKFYIQKLCEKCTNNNVKKDCFISELDITDENNITAEETDVYMILEDIPYGKSIIKVSLDDKCMVRRLE